jgi:hypothetical protein
MILFGRLCDDVEAFERPPEGATYCIPADLSLLEDTDEQPN